MSERKFEYSGIVTRTTRRTKEMGYEIDLDENGNIISATERWNIGNGVRRIKSGCRTQDQGDKDFESHVTKCLRSIFEHEYANDLIEALNEKMIERYFVKVYKPK